MGKIIIVEEKADMMVDKLHKMKNCVEDIMECLIDSREGHQGGYDDEDDDWDDEYEIKRRRAGRKRYARGGRMSRY